MRIPDWRGVEIEVGRSAGGVVAVANPWENVIRTGVSPWPAPELLQKLYQSKQTSAYRDSDLSIVLNAHGFYSDLQSLHSEDAITWSVFGPIAYACASIQVAYVDCLLKTLQIDCEPVRSTRLWLWRRIPHPETLVSGGPEIDFGIQTGTVFLLGEAKWMSKVSKDQGIGRNRTQLELRHEFCRTYGPRILPTCRHFVVLSVSLNGGLLSSTSENVGGVAFHSRDTTWDTLASLDAHPLKAEVRAYLDWKRSHSRMKAARVGDSHKARAAIAAESGTLGT